MNYINISFLILLTTSINAFAGQFKNSSLSEKLEFKNKCDQGEEVTISAVGDVLLHSPLQQQAFQDQNTYKSLWPKMIPIFKKFAISYANFEGPSAEGLGAAGRKSELGFKYNSQIYSSYPSFNYHPHLVKDLIDSGIDIVSTANNHSLDRRGLGADMTIDAMLQYGLRFTGTKSKNIQNQGWHTETVVNGHRIAWLACTFSTNGVPDTNKQVLFCYENKQEVLNYVYALSKDPRYAAVIVTPHWGNEYQFYPVNQEMSFGRQLIEAGALAVLGTHPHVIQPWEKYQSTRTGQEGLIVYSSGNFVSGQFHRIPTQVGLMIGLKLVLNKETQHFNIKNVKYLPLLMKRYPIRVEPITDDSLVGSEFAKIWQNMYPSKNRISQIELDSTEPMRSDDCK